MLLQSVSRAPIIPLFGTTILPFTQYSGSKDGMPVAAEDLKDTFLCHRFLPRAAGGKLQGEGGKLTPDPLQSLQARNPPPSRRTDLRKLGEGKAWPLLLLSAKQKVCPD